MTGSSLGPPSDFQKCLPLRSSEIHRSALIAVVSQYTHPRHLLLQSRLTPLCPIPLFVSGECCDLYLSQSAAGHGSCFHDDNFHYSYFYEFVAWLELTKTRSSFHWSRHPWRTFFPSRLFPVLTSILHSVIGKKNTQSDADPLRLWQEVVRVLLRWWEKNPFCQSYDSLHD